MHKIWIWIPIHHLLLLVTMFTWFSSSNLISTSRSLSGISIKRHKDVSSQQPLIKWLDLGIFSHFTLCKFHIFWKLFTQQHVFKPPKTFRRGVSFFTNLNFSSVAAMTHPLLFIHKQYSPHGESDTSLWTTAKETTTKWFKHIYNCWHHGFEILKD